MSSDVSANEKPRAKGFAAKATFDTEFSKELLPGLQELPRIHKPTAKEFFENYVKPQRPVIVTGTSENWNIHKWRDLEYLKSKVGKHLVHPRPQGGRKLLLHTQEMTFSEFVDQAAERNLYLAIATIMRPAHNSFNRFMERKVHPAYLPELADDFEVPFFDRRDVWEVDMWMGPGGSETPLHNDQFDNIYCQVKGRKRFLLFPPTNNPGFLGDERHPDGTITYEGYEYVINPGEILYYPKFWYHRVFSENDWVVSINMWFLRNWRDYLCFYANEMIEDVPFKVRMKLNMLLIKDKAEFNFWYRTGMLRPLRPVLVGAPTHGQVQAELEDD